VSDEMFCGPGRTEVSDTEPGVAGEPCVHITRNYWHKFHVN